MKMARHFSQAILKILFPGKRLESKHFQLSIINYQLLSYFQQTQLTTAEFALCIFQRNIEVLYFLRR